MLQQLQLMSKLFGLIECHCNLSSILSVVSTCILVSCSSSEPAQSELAISTSASPEARIASLVSQGESSQGNQAALFFLQAAEQYLAEGLLDETTDTLDRITNPDSLSDSNQLRVAIARARVAEGSNRLAVALRWLTGALTSSADPNTVDGANFFTYLGTLYVKTGQAVNALRTFSEVTPYFENDASSSVFDQVWLALQEIDERQLQSLAGSAASYELRGWIELARVYHNSEFSIRSQLDSLSQWQRVWSSHSAATRLPQALADLQSIWNERPRHIALLLPTQQQSGITIQEGFFSAYYASLDATREVPKVTVIDTSNADDVFELYDSAVSQGADLVIGPLNKSLVNQYQAREELPVTTLALNYLDNPSAGPYNLFQFGLAPEDEINQLANLAWDAGHKNVAVFTPESADYVRLQNAFRETWQSLGGEVVSTATFTDTNDFSDTVKRLMAIDSSEARAERILDLLPRSSIEFVPRRRQDIDFIFLIANPRQGRLIKPTLAFYFAENVPVYSMPSIYEGNLNPNEDRDLNGIWFADAPWTLQQVSDLKSQVTANLRPASGQLQRLRALGIDSFRLYARLSQLADGNINRIPGATGILTIQSDGTIHRQLNIARFVNGEAEEQF